jgi:glycosyltransferase involved in cell wall biosynthesis
MIEKRKATNRVFIIDPSFQSMMGHHAPYDLAVLEELKKHGVKVVILSNKNVASDISIPEGGVLDKVFSHTAWGNVTSKYQRSLADFFCFPYPRQIVGAFSCLVAWILAGRRRRLHYYELIKALESHSFGDGDILFAHMVLNYSLVAYAFLANHLVEENKGEMVILFRYPSYLLKPYKLRTKLCFRFLEKAFRLGRARGATDSSLLADDYKRYLAMPLTVYPTPHAPSIRQERQTAREKRPLRCVSLGNARTEKGILEIFEAIRLLNSTGQGAQFSFGLQVNAPDEQCLGEVRRFTSEARENVELYADTLSARGYEELLKNADVVLVPYHREEYLSRTSGVMLEGLTTGKIIVSTEGTWMESELRKFDAAYELVPDKTPNALADALLKIADNFLSYESRRSNAAIKAREFHNPHTLVEKLLNGF